MKFNLGFILYAVAPGILAMRPEGRDMNDEPTIELRPEGTSNMDFITKTSKSSTKKPSKTEEIDFNNIKPLGPNDVIDLDLSCRSLFDPRTNSADISALLKFMSIKDPDNWKELVYDGNCTPYFAAKCDALSENHVRELLDKWDDDKTLDAAAERLKILEEKNCLPKLRGWNAVKVEDLPKLKDIVVSNLVHWPEFKPEIIKAFFEEGRLSKVAVPPETSVAFVKAIFDCESFQKGSGTLWTLFDESMVLAMSKASYGLANNLSLFFEKVAASVDNDWKCVLLISRTATIYRSVKSDKNIRQENKPKQETFKKICETLQRKASSNKAKEFISIACSMSAKNTGIVGTNEISGNQKLVNLTHLRQMHEESKSNDQISLRRFIAHVALNFPIYEDTIAPWIKDIENEVSDSIKSLGRALELHGDELSASYMSMDILSWISLLLRHQGRNCDAASLLKNTLVKYPKFRAHFLNPNLIENDQNLVPVIFFLITTPEEMDKFRSMNNQPFGNVRNQLPLENNEGHLDYVTLTKICFVNQEIFANPKLRIDIYGGNHKAIDMGGVSNSAIEGMVKYLWEVSHLIDLVDEEKMEYKFSPLNSRENGSFFGILLQKGMMVKCRFPRFHELIFQLLCSDFSNPKVSQEFFEKLHPNLLKTIDKLQDVNYDNIDKTLLDMCNIPKDRFYLVNHPPSLAFDLEKPSKEIHFTILELVLTENEIKELGGLDDTDKLANLEQRLVDPRKLEFPSKVMDELKGMKYENMIEMLKGCLERGEKLKFVYKAILEFWVDTQPQELSEIFIKHLEDSDELKFARQVADKIKDKQDSESLRLLQRCLITEQNDFIYKKVFSDISVKNLKEWIEILNLLNISESKFVNKLVEKFGIKKFSDVLLDGFENHIRNGQKWKSIYKKILELVSQNNLEISQYLNKRKKDNEKFRVEYAKRVTELHSRLRKNFYEEFKNFWFGVLHGLHINFYGAGLQYLDWEVLKEFISLPPKIDWESFFRGIKWVNEKILIESMIPGENITKRQAFEAFMESLESPQVFRFMQIWTGLRFTTEDLIVQFKNENSGTLAKFYITDPKLEIKAVTAKGHDEHKIEEKVAMKVKHTFNQSSLLEWQKKKDTPESLAYYNALVRFIKVLSQKSQKPHKLDEMNFEVYDGGFRSPHSSTCFRTLYLEFDSAREAFHILYFMLTESDINQFFDVFRNDQETLEHKREQEKLKKELLKNSKSEIKTNSKDKVSEEDLIGRIENLNIEENVSENSNTGENVRLEIIGLEEEIEGSSMNTQISSDDKNNSEDELSDGKEDKEYK